MEKREFNRVRLTAKSTLSHHDAIFQGQLQNISPKGALIRLEQGIIVPRGGEYNLTVFIDGEDTPLQLIAEIVCVNFSLAGIKFVSCESDTEIRLNQLVEKLSSGPDKLRTEQERIRNRLANYLQEH